MVDISKYLGSYLKAEDMEGKPPLTLTISAVVSEKVGREGKTEDKLILQFAEVEQVLPLNKVNLKLLVKILGSKETNEWIGQRIVLYHDPNVMYKSELVGGLRVRKVSAA